MWKVLWPKFIYQKKKLAANEFKFLFKESRAAACVTLSFDLGSRLSNTLSTEKMKIPTAKWKKQQKFCENNGNENE